MATQANEGEAANASSQGGFDSAPPLSLHICTSTQLHAGTGLSWALGIPEHHLPLATKLAQGNGTQAFET
ncbi:hypothetical protein F444_01473 [Phytophthora nicotianae P1976]|uniref:Uncharacterized protein n=1 Tax=Phytophthora nicotianae P1976 TaxID=1317066 RepID=A0A081B0G5_PHYNI|nr:hypothetical protein F444_01473 [Phytophthora nicotianae P1976]